MRFALVLALLFTCIQTARADTMSFSALELYNSCASQDVNVNRACRYYVMGAAQIAQESTSQIGICIPDGMTTEKLISVYQETATDDFTRFPNDKTMPASTLFLAALAHEYGCKK